MIYDWYKIFNRAEFIDTGLASRKLVVNLEGVGQKEIVLSQGNTVSMCYEDAFLPVGFLNRNPYAQGDYAVYVDGAEDVWLGIATA